MKNRLEDNVQQATEMLAKLRADTALAEALTRLGAQCVASLRAGGQILFAGNGGSAADAQHWAAELTGRYAYDRPALAGLALTTDTSALTAIGNDYGYDQTFSRQLEGLGRKGDVFIGISTSGNSANVLRAIDSARKKGIVTAGFTGAGGGKMGAVCDIMLRVPASYTPVIQQGHALLGHVLCEYIEAEMFPRR